MVLFEKKYGRSDVKFFPPHFKKQTKVLCTIGPSSDSVTHLQNMHRAGMDAVRINTAHTSISDIKRLTKIVRRAGDFPIVVDIKGPELRIITDASYTFAKNHTFTIYFSQKSPIRFNYNLQKYLRIGDTILIQDGKYHLRIVKKTFQGCVVKALEHCVIETNKNVHIPGRKLALPSLNEKDKKALALVRKEKIDYVALSFCRSAQDIYRVRALLKDSSVGIIAKIENHEGIQNINEIISAADGVMVARGDLGVELSPEKVPLLQKEIIRACNQEGKLVIVATQMLESMITQDTPTRAEISDVANAVLDGADCLMLSAETAVGKYPVKAVRYMSTTAASIEGSVELKPYTLMEGSVSDALSFSVSSISAELPISKILCLTVSGHTAQRISRFRIKDVPIIAITTTKRVQRKLMLYYGILPVLYVPNFDFLDIPRIFYALHQVKIISKKDIALFTAGMFTVRNRKTNILQIHRVDDVLDYRKRFVRSRK